LVAFFILCLSSYKKSHHARLQQSVMANLYFLFNYGTYFRSRELPVAGYFIA
jgi:hypothetical protein